MFWLTSFNTILLAFAHVVTGNYPTCYVGVVVDNDYSSSVTSTYDNTYDYNETFTHIVNGQTYTYYNSSGCRVEYEGNEDIELNKTYYIGFEILTSNHTKQVPFCYYWRYDINGNLTFKVIQFMPLNCTIDLQLRIDTNVQTIRPFDIHLNLIDDFSNGTYEPLPDVPSNVFGHNDIYDTTHGVVTYVNYFVNRGSPVTRFYWMNEYKYIDVDQNFGEYLLSCKRGENIETQTAYEEGHDIGYNEGIADAHTYTFFSLFGSIADTPIMIFRQLLGFDVFGVSALQIFMTMFTGVIVLFIFRRIIGSF